MDGIFSLINSFLFGNWRRKLKKLSDRIMLPGQTYHFFNHANGFENLFRESRNYWYFIDKVKKYLLPVADIYCYSLMPNHFHLVGQIRPEEQLLKIIKQFKSLRQDQVEQKISKAFSNLFSCYTQSFNKLYKRMGSLFVPNMKRKLIVNDSFFCNVVRYVHTNPVHHGFVKHIHEWEYTSYNAFIHGTDSFVNKRYVLDIFGGLEEFIKYHNSKIILKTKF